MRTKNFEQRFKEYQIGFSSFVIKMYIPDVSLFVTFLESLGKYIVMIFLLTGPFMTS